jgi:hypothetical protein
MLLAQVQQDILHQNKPWRQAAVYKPEVPVARPEVAKLAMKIGHGEFWKERQLRDYRRANGLCFKCGDKYDPQHQCIPKAQAEVHALQLENNREEISETVLNLLAWQDFQDNEQLQLSLYALSGANGGDTIRLRALVGNQVLIILVDSGSSHNFVNSQLLQRCQLQTTPISAASVKVASGALLECNQVVKNMEWWTQGHTFVTDMHVLDLGAYDAILGVSWLKQCGDIC